MLAKLSAANLELTRGLADVETRNKKLKRRANRDEHSLKEPLAVAQNLRP